MLGNFESLKKSKILVVWGTIFFGNGCKSAGCTTKSLIKYEIWRCKLNNLIREENCNLRHLYPLWALDFPNSACSLYSPISLESPLLSDPYHPVGFFCFSICRKRPPTCQAANSSSNTSPRTNQTYEYEDKKLLRGDPHMVVRAYIKSVSPSVSALRQPYSSCASFLHISLSFMRCTFSCVTFVHALHSFLHDTY